MTLWTGSLHAPAAVSRAGWRTLTAYLAAAMVLLLPLALNGPTVVPASRLISAEIDDGSGGWRDADLGALTLPAGRVSTVRVQAWVDPAVATSGEPLGLYLSGTFSAAAVWNGAAVGAKGTPGATPAAERPGPIDTVLPLPAAQVRPGANTLVLRISSAHLAHKVRTVIHGQGGLFGVRVAPFSAEARRPLGYYAAPFFMSGVLLLGFAVLVLRGEARTAGALVLAALAAAALAEVSRSVVNYPYPLQAARMLTVTLAINVAGAAVLTHAGSLAGLTGRPRLALAVAAAVVVTATLVPIWGRVDAFQLAVATAAAICGWAAARGRPGAAELAAALMLMSAFALVDGPAFLDRSLYAAAAPLVAYLVWRRRAPPSAQPSSERLAVGPAGARRFVAYAEIRAIHGAGDYAELRLASGERILADETLQALIRRLPETFVRIHRSHIVNLAHVTALSGQGGGRYRLQLAGGDWLPVARTRIAEVRTRLGSSSR